MVNFISKSVLSAKSVDKYFQDKRVLITGGAGFLAWHLIRALVERGADVRAVDIAPKPDDFHPEADYYTADLLSREECKRAIKGAELVFHLAAVGWGFHENLKRQPQILTENMLLNSNVLDVSYRLGVGKYLFTSSAAVYPGVLKVMREDAPLNEPPHGSEQYYAWSKRIGEIQAKAYFEHYNLPAAIVRLFNPYGPGDNFDPENSHVIPALIRRAVEGDNPFTVWGTGNPVRSFVHARDVAEGMIRAMEKYAVCEPVNLASNETASIREIVNLILELSGHDPEIVYDTNKPDGHPRRVAVVERATEALGMRDYIPLREGLRETIDWYLDNKQRI